MQGKQYPVPEPGDSSNREIHQIETVEMDFTGIEGRAIIFGSTVAGDTSTTRDPIPPGFFY